MVFLKELLSSIFGTYNNLLLEAEIPVTRMLGKFSTKCKQCSNHLLVSFYKLKENNFFFFFCANTSNNTNS